MTGSLSIGEETLALHLKAAKIPFEREFKFHPDRKWRLDFWLLNTNIAIEIDGGTAYGKSRHSFGAGYENDSAKANEAAMMGFKLLRFTTAMVKRGEAIATIERALKP